MDDWAAPTLKPVAMTDAFRICDDTLRQGIQGVTDLITIPGLINLDFADIRTEDHIGLGQSLADLRPALLGGLAAHLGVRAGPEAARQLFADVDGLVGIGHEQGLTVGIDRDELDAAHTGLHHAVSRVASVATRPTRASTCSLRRSTPSS